jgi:hypothetical protein
MTATLSSNPEAGLLMVVLHIPGVSGSNLSIKTGTMACFSWFPLVLRANGEIVF